MTKPTNRSDRSFLGLRSINDVFPSGLEPGSFVGQYEIIRLIGRGGMGAVYEAVHPGLRKRVAIKVLIPTSARHPEATDRFVREGEAVARIRHPHVVDVTDMGFHGEQPYLVMELLEGQDLGSYLGAVGRLSVADAIDLMLPVIAAVGAGHEVGVIHRDLKPQNVMLVPGDDGEPFPKVLDFGIARLLDEPPGVRLTETKEVMGTVAYMSPEQARGSRDVDERSDQYALGLLAYECLTGEPAVDGGNPFSLLRRIGDGSIDFLSRRTRRLPAELDRAVMKALEFFPGDRHAHLRAFGQALLPFASPRAQASWSHVFGGFADPLPPRRSRVARWMLVLTGLGLGLGGIGMSCWRPAPAPPHTDTAPRPVITVVPLPDDAGTIRVNVRVTPPHAELTLDGEPAVRGGLDRVLRADGTRHVLTVRADGYEPQTIVFASAPPPPLVTLVPVEPSKAPRDRRPARARPARKAPPKLGPNQTPIIFG